MILTDRCLTFARQHVFGVRTQAIESYKLQYPAFIDSDGSIVAVAWIYLVGQPTYNVYHWEIRMRRTGRPIKDKFRDRYQSTNWDSMYRG